jgi:AraC-like DNA-binding protein
MLNVLARNAVTAPQIRAVTLSAYVDAVRALGVDPYELLRSAKIRPEELGDPENRIAASAVVKLLDESAALADCASLGILLVQDRDLASVGPISLLLQHRLSLRDSIKSMIAHQRMFNDIVDISLDDDGETALLRVELMSGFWSQHLVETFVAISCRTLRGITDDRWQPECIHFRHAAPADLQIHQHFFNCRIEFDSDFDGISCASSSLDIANPAANDAMACHAKRFVELLAPQHRAHSVCDQVKQAISGALGRYGVTMEGIADSLGLHSRMLQRQLEKEGTTFAILLNEVRRDLALRYLANSNHSVTEVSLLLGYSALSSFSRWFTLEFGKPPAAWRSAKRCEALGPGEYALKPVQYAVNSLQCA